MFIVHASFTCYYYIGHNKFWADPLIYCLPQIWHYHQNILFLWNDLHSGLFSLFFNIIVRPRDIECDEEWWNDFWELWTTMTTTPLFQAQIWNFIFLLFEGIRNERASGPAHILFHLIVCFVFLESSPSHTGWEVRDLF